MSGFYWTSNYFDNIDISVYTTMKSKFAVILLMALRPALSYAQTEVTETPEVTSVVASATNTTVQSHGRWEGSYISGAYSLLRNELNSYSNNLYNGADTSLLTSNKSSAGTASIQVGYNWQIDSYVVGVEADVGTNTLSNTSCRGGQYSNTPCGDTYYGTLNLTGETKYQGALLGKLGYDFNDFMLYTLAGAAFIKATNILNVDCPTGCGAFDAIAITNTTAISRNKVEFAYGFGGEYMLDANLRFGLDFLYFKSPDLTQSITHDATYGPQVITSANTSSNSLVRAKLIYAF